MVVVMEERATEAQIEQVIAQSGRDGHGRAPVDRRRRARCSAPSGRGTADPRLIEMLDGVHEVLRISEPYKLASRTFKPEDTVVTIGDVRIGGDEVIVMAGPVLGGDRGAGRRDGGRGASGPARRSSAAAPSSRAARRTASRGSAKKGCACCATRPIAEDLTLVSEVMDISQIELIEQLRATSSRSARATCRTSRCCASSGTRASRCCSSAASRPRSRSGCSRRSTC